MWFRCRDLAAGFCGASCESRDARARHGDLARVAMRCAPNLGRRPDGDHLDLIDVPADGDLLEPGGERVRGVGRRDDSRRGCLLTRSLDLVT